MTIYHYTIIDTKNGNSVFPNTYELLGIPENEFENIKRILQDAGYKLEQGKLRYKKGEKCIAIKTK